MIRLNAELFRAANLTASTEETRYYLNGVFVHANPNGPGVLIVATDGHRLTCILDRSGSTDEPGRIVRLSPEALKACRKPGEDRALTIDGGNATILSRRTGAPADAPWVPVAISPACYVDGTFPDWRRVLPNIDAEAPIVTDTFDSGYLAELAAMGRDLALAFAVTPAAKPGKHPAVKRRAARDPAMSIHSTSKGSPAVIRWYGVPDAFAILMPMRPQADMADSSGPALPAFLFAAGCSTPWGTAPAPTPAEPVAETVEARAAA